MYQSFYKKCNFVNCESTICDNYVCTQDGFNPYDLYYYYSCQGKCSPLNQYPVPNQIYVGFVLAVIATCTYGLAIVLALGYGIVAGTTGSRLTTLERMSLLLNFVWPKFKYFAFMKRTNFPP